MMTLKISIMIIFIVLVVISPLFGVYLSGQPIEPFGTFPPLTTPVEQPDFSWPVFFSYLIFSLGIIILLGVASLRQTSGTEKTTYFSRERKRLVWWGWLGLALLLLFWFFAWTRISWFSPLQRMTFVPLWFSYILLANGVCLRQTGKCPLLHDTQFFLILFPLSGVFWWFFEYLNQIVHNWYYVGVDYGPLAYGLHASVSFSTVLPAVYTTRIIVGESTWFKDRFHNLPSLKKVSPLWMNTVLLVLGCVGLTAVGIWPDKLFALVWVAPLLLLTGLLHLGGFPSQIGEMVKGDWRPATSAALAALFCGGLWEMWNYLSMAKWLYNVPFVHRFEIFEMPLLGYMGYLPFGIFCLEIVEFFSSFRSRGK